MFYVIDAKTSKQFYGGDQGWFVSNTRAYAGCGPVAAANMWITLLKKHPQLIKPSSQTLLQPAPKQSYSANVPSCDKNTYMDLMNNLYEAIKTLEVPVLNWIYDHCSRENKFFKKVAPTNGRSICGFIKGFLRYAKNQGVLLHAHTLPTAFCSYEKGLHFIEAGLKECGAVVLLTSFNRHPLTLYRDTCGKLEQPYELKEGMRCHFATITDIFYPADSSPVLILSTWGRIASVKLDSLAATWQSRKALDSALFYFTPADFPEVTDKGIKSARRMLFQAVRQTLFKKSYT